MYVSSVLCYFCVFSCYCLTKNRVPLLHNYAQCRIYALVK